MITKLFNVLEERKITPYALAKMCGFPSSSQVYTYRDRMPSLRAAIIISDQLGMSVNELWQIEEKN